jgi:hypothetical protein
VTIILAASDIITVQLMLIPKIRVVMMTAKLRMSVKGLRRRAMAGQRVFLGRVLSAIFHSRKKERAFQSSQEPVPSAAAGTEGVRSSSAVSTFKSFSTSSFTIPTGALGKARRQSKGQALR